MSDFIVCFHPIYYIVFGISIFTNEISRFYVLNGEGFNAEKSGIWLDADQGKIFWCSAKREIIKKYATSEDERLSSQMQQAN